jgi:hypothetical protein
MAGMTDQALARSLAAVLQIIIEKSRRKTFFRRAAAG